MRVWAPILLALTPLGACGGAAAPVNQAAATPDALPALTGRVVDLGNVLSAEQEAALAAKSAALKGKTKHQLVIVTVAGLNGQTVEAYSLALANRWGIGRKDHNDGVLLLVAPNERKVRIEVGAGLVRALDNDRAAKIIQDVILPEFRAGRLPEGMSKGTDAIIARLSEPSK